MITYEDDASYAKNILNTLNAMRRNQVACDGVIYSENGTAFVIHRSVMATCSPYFRTLFTTPLRGDGGGEGLERTSAVVPGVSDDILGILVDFAYTRITNVNHSNVFNLFTAADQFSVEDMVEDCCKFLAENLTPQNCIGVWNFSKQYFCSELKEIAWSYVMHNFTNVLSTSEELLDQPFDVLTQILSPDKLCVRDEFDIWTFIIRWIDRDFPRRSPLLPNVLQIIRLGLISEDVFMRFVKSHPYVKGNAACRPILVQAMKMSHNWDNDTSGFPYLMRARMPEAVILCIGGWSLEGPTDIMEAYDCRMNTWTRIWYQDPVGPRAYHRCMVLGHFLYVIGGTDGVVCLNSCRRFDLEKKVWDFVSPMNVRRCYASCVTLNDLIYIIGGYDGEVRLMSVERYNYISNQWTLVSPMQIERSDCGACVVNGHIYVVGGFSGATYLNTVEFYDPNLDTWSMITGMLSRRSGVACVAHDGRCFVLGGYDGITRLRSCEVYDPAYRNWTAIKSMKNARSNFAVEILDGCIYVCGGYEGDHTIKDVEKYHLHKQIWKRVCSLSVSRSALAACLVNNVNDFAPKQRCTVKRTPSPPNLKRKRISCTNKKTAFRRLSGN